MLGFLDAQIGVSIKEIVVLLIATPLQSKALRASAPEIQIEIKKTDNILTVD